ncbi:hypothetical protein [Fulvimarina sp. MAC8]|uniref:hypothetical protein n=1 Tax=Fulvimarina sp. MAC8 TaxID=3162874 RepID=UPI0032EF5DEC
MHYGGCKSGECESVSNDETGSAKRTVWDPFVGAIAEPPTAKPETFIDRWAVVIGGPALFLTITAFLYGDGTLSQPVAIGIALVVIVLTCH